jgi:hypothetical protein
MLGFLHILKKKGSYSHMKAINIINTVCMEYEGMNEYKCKSTVGFVCTTSKQWGLVIETLLMMMTMEIDVEAFKILVPYPLVWW